MLSNCMMLKTRAITKICSCAELTYTWNTWGKRFIIIVIMSRYFEIFTSCQGSTWTFSKHHCKCKTVSTKFIAREETANIKIFTGKPTKQFCLLLWLKSRSARGTSHHLAFMGNCRTISHTFYSPIYPVDERNDDVGSVSDNILLFLELFDF